MEQTLLEHYGGMPFVSRLVLDFYDRVRASPRLKPYFERSDMRRLVDHQAKFISTLLGGPVVFSDEMIAAIHRHVAIDDAAFDEMIALLDGTLADFNLTEQDRAAIVAAFRQRRPILVTRHTSH
jgi:hemoglobin